MACSEKKRLANQRNAQMSTGPKRPEGKARSSQNAIKHGIFCVQTVVLKNEDESLFRFTRRSTIQDLRPQNFLELQFVDALVYAQWRLLRLQKSEALMYISFRDKLMDHFLETWTEQDGEAGKLRALEEEKILDENPDHASCLMARMLIEPGQDQITKFGKYEQRLQNTVHRCLRELRQLRKDREVIDALPPSPFDEELPPAPPLASCEELPPTPLPSPLQGVPTYSWEAKGKGEGRAIVEEVANDLQEENGEHDSAERTQPTPCASPSHLPLTSHEYVAASFQGEGIENGQNEANVRASVGECDGSKKDGVTRGDPAGSILMESRD
jgi:hypothetical protein